MVLPWVPEVAALWHPQPSPFLVQLRDILHPHAEDEQVFLSSLLGHLHVGSIHGADGQSPVQHELHVACPRGLGARCGDLL